MPNHVTHRVTVTGPADEIARFRQTCITTQTETNWEGKEEESVTGFDFNAIVPMPQVLRDSESSSDVDWGLIILGRWEINTGDFLGRCILEKADEALNYPWVREAGVTTKEQLQEFLKTKFPGADVVGRRAAAAYDETGYLSWYPWALAHWGTKWNAYSYEELSDEPESFGFQFDTAWSTPEPIWDELAEMFPALTFTVVGFDEGWCFAVTGTIAEGTNEVAVVKATEELYEATYGEAYERPEDEEDEEVDGMGHRLDGTGPGAAAE